MSGKNRPYIDDPENFNGDYVGAGDFAKPIINEYDIRAFAKYRTETGREWKDLSEREKHNFKLAKYR